MGAVFDDASAPTMVDSRCAMTTIVRSGVSSEARASWMACSDSASAEAVGSSNTSTRGSSSSVRAMHTRCACPPDRFASCPYTES